MRPEGCPTHTFDQVLSDVQSYLIPEPHLYPRFLTLVEQLVDDLTGADTRQIIEEMAHLLTAVPSMFHRLNPLFQPYARVQFDARSARVTSFVLQTQGSSWIVNLSPSHDRAPLELHNLSALQFGEILTHGTARGLTKEDLCGITNTALRNCLAQLAQDLIDDPKTSKIYKKQALQFLRHPAAVPPSLLLYDLKQVDDFDSTCFSDLYKGTYNGLQVIIKKPRVCKGSFPSSEIIREIILCHQLHHPNILPFLGVTLDGRSEQCRLYGLVTPFMKNGNVAKFLERYPNINRVTLIWQITKGLEFLHKLDPPIAHCDVKCANVLVNHNFVCCLTDFGSSSIPEITQRSRNQATCTFLWMAPEFGVEGADLPKSDIFSLGITIFEMYMGEPPNRFAYRDLRPHLPPTCLHSFPAYLDELVSMMLDDPSKRPSAHLISQALEDNLIFPRKINIGVSNKDPDTTIQTTNYKSARDIAQVWVTKEREREELEKIANEPAVPLSLHERNVSQETQQGPLPKYVLCRDSPTPVVGTAPLRLPRVPTSTKKHLSLNLPTPPDSPRITTVRSIQPKPLRSFDDILHPKNAI